MHAAEPMRRGATDQSQGNGTLTTQGFVLGAMLTYLDQFVAANPTADMQASAGVRERNVTNGSPHACLEAKTLQAAIKVPHLRSFIQRALRSCIG